jgi:hypothetical protein
MFKINYLIFYFIIVIRINLIIIASPFFKEYDYDWLKFLIIKIIEYWISYLLNNILPSFKRQEMWQLPLFICTFFWK